MMNSAANPDRFNGCIIKYRSGRSAERQAVNIKQEGSLLMPYRLARRRLLVSRAAESHEQRAARAENSRRRWFHLHFLSGVFALWIIWLGFGIVISIELGLRDTVAHAEHVLRRIPYWTHDKGLR